MSNVLDKVWFNASCPVNTSTYTNWLLNSGHKVNLSFKVIASNKSVIKSVNWGTSCPWTWNKPMSK